MTRKSAFITLALTSLAVLGLSKSITQIKETHLDFEFPVKRCSTGLFV